MAYVRSLAQKLMSSRSLSFTLVHLSRVCVCVFGVVLIKATNAFFQIQQNETKTRNNEEEAHVALYVMCTA